MGRPRSSQAASDTTTECGRPRRARARSTGSSEGEPISSSISHSSRTPMGTPASRAAADSEERGQRGPLVVGGAAPEVPVAAAHEAEGLGAPSLRLAVRRLHVEVVVQDDGRRPARSRRTRRRRPDDRPSAPRGPVRPPAGRGAPPPPPRDACPSGGRGRRIRWGSRRARAAHVRSRAADVQRIGRARHAGGRASAHYAWAAGGGVRIRVPGGTCRYTARRGCAQRRNG